MVRVDPHAGEVLYVSEPSSDRLVTDSVTLPATATGYCKGTAEASGFLAAAAEGECLMRYDWTACLLVLVGSFFTYNTQHSVIGLLLMMAGMSIIIVLMKLAGYTGLVVMYIVFMLANVLSFYEKYGAR